LQLFFDFLKKNVFCTVLRTFSVPGALPGGCFRRQNGRRFLRRLPFRVRRNGAGAPAKVPVQPGILFFRPKKRPKIQPIGAFYDFSCIAFVILVL